MISLGRAFKVPPVQDENQASKNIISLMASSNNPRVLEMLWISPPPNSVLDTSVPLTSFDIPLLNTPPVHRIFFYPSPEPAASFIESLKSSLSLSLTLQHFYTLAGAIRISSDKIDIIYTNGDAVAFTVAESNSDFRQLASNQKLDYFTQLYPLLPQLSGLLAIQVTLFPEQGICIGVTIHHVVADGTSSVGFLKSWASACKSGALTATPFYDRSWFTEISQIYEALYSQQIQSRPVTPVLYSQQIQSRPVAPASPSKRTFLASFTLRRYQIERLKKRVREHDEKNHCSTFVVSCAYAWVCHVRALGYESDSTAHLMFPVDCRGRLDPPLPPSYFGNCVSACLVDESVSVLTGEDGVVAAAVEIGKAVDELKGGIIEAGLRLSKKLLTVSHAKLLSVSGSPKFGVYDVDFGLGRPVRVEMPSIQKNLTICLAESKEGDCGVEIGVAFEEGDMEEFEAQFYEVLPKLSE